MKPRVSLRAASSFFPVQDATEPYIGTPELPDRSSHCPEYLILKVMTALLR